MNQPTVKEPAASFISPDKMSLTMSIDHDSGKIEPDKIYSLLKISGVNFGIYNKMIDNLIEQYNRLEWISKWPPN